MSAPKGVSRHSVVNNIYASQYELALEKGDFAIMNTKVMSLAAVVAAAMSGQASALETKPAHIDLGDSGLKLTPKLELKQTRNSNIYSTEDNEVYSGITNARPSVSVWAEKGNSKYNVDFAIEAVNYNSAHDNDRVDWELAAGVDQEFNSRNRLDVLLSAGTYTEDATFDGQEELPEYDGVNAELTYGFGAKSATLSFDLYGKHKSKSYNEISESKDSTNTSFGGIAYFAVAPKTKALLEVRNTELEYDNRDSYDFSVDTVLVGATWESTAKTTGFVKVGVQDQDRDAGNSSDSEAWEIGVTYQPKSYSTFTFSTESGYELESQSGEFSEFSAFVAGWNHDWSSKWATDLSLTVKDEDLLNADGDVQVSRDLMEVSATVHFLANRWSKVSFGVKGTDRDADDGDRVATSFDKYDRSEVFVGVELTM